MRRFRPCLLALALALSACAGTYERQVYDSYRANPDRVNGQPRWLPCMQGDALCR